VIPSNIGRQCATGTRATNAVPHPTVATRPDWTTTANGLIDFEYFMNDWYHLFSSPFGVKHHNCATYDIVSVSNVASPIDIDMFATGAYLGTATTLTVTACPLGGTISNSNFWRYGAASN